MGDPLEKIAEAVEVKSDMQHMRAEIATLTAVVQSNLAEQQRLNSSLDRSVQNLTKGLQDTRERLVAVESIACEVPGIKEGLETLRNNMARYVGMYSGGALVLSALISLAVAFGVKIWG